MGLSDVEYMSQWSGARMDLLVVAEASFLVWHPDAIQYSGLLIISFSFMKTLSFSSHLQRFQSRTSLFYQLVAHFLSP